MDKQPERVERMQNAINWAARAASVPIGPTWAYFIGAVIDELRALDNGAPLTTPKERP